MIRLKKSAALLLCAVMLFSFASCRTENENAVVYSDADGNSVEVRSALYILYAMDAMSEYQSEYSEQTTTTTVAESETDTAAGEETTTVNYANTSLDDKTYNEWVQDRALELCSEYAFVEIEYEKAQLSFTEDQTSSVKSTVDQYWSSNEKLYTKNGVAKSTLKLYIDNMQKKQALFDHYYGEGGSKEIPMDNIKSYLTENCLLVQFLSYSLQGYDSSGNTTSPTDEEKAEYKELLNGYVTRLNAGEDYAKVRAEYFEKIGQTDSVSAEGSTAKYPYAMVMGDEDSSINPFEKFDEVKALEIGKAKLIETDSMYSVMQRVDLNADLDYCAKENASAVRHEMKDDEYEKLIENGGSELTADKNSSAINYYRADKLALTADE